MYIRKIYYLSIGLIILNCAGNDLINENLDSKLNKAISLFKVEKYSKAREQFEYIIFNNPGSSNALKSQYYLAESLYKLRNYNQASKEYDKFIMLSQDSELVAKSKFLICKCLYLLSSDYNKDQNETKFTIDKIQYFIEEYPTSHHKIECEEMIHNLRSKLAQKELESGKLYLRIEKYDSALIYFNLIMVEYYDTSYYDDALFNVVLTYLLKGETKLAESFLIENKENFITENKFKESEVILNNAKQKLKIKNYFKLLK